MPSQKRPKGGQSGLQEYEEIQDRILKLVLTFWRLVRILFVFIAWFKLQIKLKHIFLIILFVSALLLDFIDELV